MSLIGHLSVIVQIGFDPSFWNMLGQTRIATRGGARGSCPPQVLKSVSVPSPLSKNNNSNKHRSRTVICGMHSVVSNYPQNCSSSKNPFTSYHHKNVAMAICLSPTFELQDVTYHMGSHSVTCHPTQVNAPRLTPAMQAGTRFPYPGGMEGWVDVVDLIAPRPGVEIATFRSRVRRRTTAPPRQRNN